MKTALMKTAWRTLVPFGILGCALLFASPSQAQEPASAAWSGGFTAVASDPDPDPPDPGCFTYTNDLRYCSVVKVKDGVCVHNRWGQYHNGQTGPNCTNCFDAVDNSRDFLVSHTETPLEQGCYPYNDCQFTTIWGLCSY